MMSAEEFVIWNSNKLNQVIKTKEFNERLAKNQKKNLQNSPDDIYVINNVRGHYEVFKNGIFYCSADTYGEAAKEIPS